MTTKIPLVSYSGSLSEMASTDTLPVANLGSGTANTTTFLRGDGAWVLPTASNIGYLNVPQNIQNAAYTLVLDDSGKHIYHSDATARIYTIPANSVVAFPIGTSIVFINDGSGSVSIAINTDTLVLVGAGTTGTRTLAQNGMATAIKVSATKWFINGGGLT